MRGFFDTGRLGGNGSFVKLRKLIRAGGLVTPPRDIYLRRGGTNLNHTERVVHMSFKIDFPTLTSPCGQFHYLPV